MGDAFINLILTYGLPALVLALVIGALGIPLPLSMLLLVAGALVRQGAFDLVLTAALALLATVLGDSISYYLGRCGGWLVRKRMEGTKAWLRAQDTFDRRGALAILLTRFLLTPLALPTNLIAGGSRYAFSRFLALDIAGELLWVALYGGLGYLFADRWQTISDLMGGLNGLLVGIVALAGVSCLAYRSLRGRRSRARMVARHA
jgi:membrane protein DedA with SNARE-associated domain